MKMGDLAALCLSAVAITGCVTRIHQESAALKAPWPTESASLRDEAARSGELYPSAGGDILAGTSPEVLAAERASASKALTDALSKP